MDVFATAAAAAAATTEATPTMKTATTSKTATAVTAVTAERARDWQARAEARRALRVRSWQARVESIVVGASGGPLQREVASFVTRVLDAVKASAKAAKSECRCRCPSRKALMRSLLARLMSLIDDGDDVRAEMTDDGVDEELAGLPHAHRVELERRLGHKFCALVRTALARRGFRVTTALVRRTDGTVAQRHFVVRWG